MNASLKTKAVKQSAKYMIKGSNFNKYNSGIYCIINKVNKKRYIGQTNDLHYRWNRHKADLNRKRHANRHLQASWNKYGGGKFEYIILEECDLQIINEREIYWIEFYNSFKKGYNQSIGGAGCRGYKHSEEEIRKMRQVQNPKPVLQYDRNGNFICRWESGAQAAKSLGLYSLAIKTCCERRNRIKSVGSFIWIYEEDKDTVNFEYYLTKGISLPKRISQYDLQMNLIKLWDSAYEIGKDGNFDHTSVTMVCKFERKTSGGFIWRYTDNYNKEQFENDKKINHNYKAIKNRRKVGKYNKYGKLLNTYESIHEAGVKNNLGKGYIRNRCINKTKQNNDVVWKYIM